MKKLLLSIILLPILIITGYFFYTQSSEKKFFKETYIPTHSLEISAYSQIGIVTSYDRSNRYYAGGNPPSNTGVCSDVITRALLDNGYNLQEKIFADIKNFPEKYSDIPDKNINHRRVKNLKIFFERNFISLPKEVNTNTIDTWQAGDIVTYEQVPGRLWHVGIVSGQKNSHGIPMLIDNHGYGTQVRISITDWESKISGHFRIQKKLILK